MTNVLETRLENGLTVLIAESHTAPVVSCWSGYHVGSRNEQPGRTGSSHWVEHMTFKGSTLLGKGDIFRLTARHGGSNNGFTSRDYTCYYETLPASELDVALMIESQRMHAALFDPEETEKERTVILAERQGNENKPHFLLAEQMSATIYREHPYRWPVIGWRADLERLTRDELLDHYRTYYRPNHAVLVIAGAVDAAAALERARHFFDEIPGGSPPPAVHGTEPPQDEERRVEVRKPGPAANLHVAYRVPGQRHADIYPLLMLDALLSGAKSVSWNGGGYMGRTARLYQALVETRLAVSAGSSLSGTVDPGIFGASLTLREGVSREQAESTLLETVEGVATAPPTQDELDRTLRQAEAQFAYSQEGVTSLAFALLGFHFRGHWSDLHRHVERLRAVTPDDVARVAATYCRPEQRTIGWFIPTPEAVSRPAESTGIRGPSARE